MPGQGPFMMITIKLDGSRVVKADYLTYGCPAAQAVGRFAAEWALGRKLDELDGFTEELVLREVGHMPLGREHCPRLAVEAMRDAAGQGDGEG